jgi:hypothetical protein
MLLLLLANDPGRAEQVRSALRCRGAIERQHIPTLRSSSHRVQQQRLARTKTIGSALAQHFAGEVTTLAACSKITRPDGVVHRAFPRRNRTPAPPSKGWLLIEHGPQLPPLLGSLPDPFPPTAFGHHRSCPRALRARSLLPRARIPSIADRALQAR